MRRARATGLARPAGLSPEQRALLWLYIFSFALDFRGEDGGAAIQLVFGALSVASSVAFLLTFRSAPSRAVSDAFSAPVWLWMSYLVSTVAMALLLGVDPGHYARVILPFVLCGLSLLVVRSICSTTSLWQEIHKPLLYASLCSAVWRPVYAVGVVGLSMDGMRYQLMSPAIAFLIAYTIWSFFFASRLSACAIAAFFLASSTILLSITRTFLGAFLLLAVFTFFLWRGAARNPSMRGCQPSGRELGMRSVLLCGVLAGVLAMVWLLRPNFVENWTSRITEQNTAHDDQDITLLTRLSEYDCQWSAICESPFYLALGKGVGSTYGINSGRFRGIEGVFGKSADSKEVWYPGHSTWVYSIYSSGFFFGWIVPGFILFGLWFSVKAVWAGRSSAGAGAMADSSLLPALVLLATLPITFPMNVFGERFSGVLMGLIVGAACALRVADISPVPTPGPTPGLRNLHGPQRRIGSRRAGGAFGRGWAPADARSGGGNAAGPAKTVRGWGRTAVTT